MMRGRACFNAHQAWRQTGEGARNFCTLKLSPHDNLSRGIDAVDLEPSLREVKANGINLHGGHSPWQSMPFSRDRPPYRCPS
jgi:hypothetical protein